MIKFASVVLIALFASSGALADTVKFAFKGTNTIKATLNNLTCELKGSDVDPVPPEGCNYEIDINEVDGTYKITLTKGEADICSPTGAEVCKFE